MQTGNARLRYSEYYDMQQTFDKLFDDSKNGKILNKLYDIIISENNIKLAYRTIKSNTGSNTKGTDNKTIKDFAIMTDEDLVRKVRNKLVNYKPGKVRRVEIPKENGKTRPLGIPTMMDRLIQQCFKQVLEPICEAKFHDHSYGFRPNRGVENAIFRMQSFINHAKMHYCVDVDIKSFFDKINHGKLLKQLWTIGIRDKRVIAIISKMLKAEIKGEGVPSMGTPQGGILSPLLANVVLNELDWWVSSQWETMELRRNYVKANKYRAMKNTKLKEVFIVRYADDFKIFCRDYKTAIKMFEATKSWINTRLKLEISEEKSKITNLKKYYSDFLGFKMKAVKKCRKVEKKDKTVISEPYYAIKSHMSDKALKNVMIKLKEKIKDLQSDLSHGNVGDFNSMILGMHNYYRIATHVCKDFNKIDFQVRTVLYNRLKIHLKFRNIKYTGKLYKQKYGDYKGKIPFLSDIAIFPVSLVRNRYPLAFDRRICNYTEQGRELIHKKLDSNISDSIQYLIRYPLREETVEFNDNRISRFSMQRGRCAITGESLELNNFDVHHKIPKELGGNDKFSNIICVGRTAHKLIHAKTKDVIDNLLNEMNLSEKSMIKLNLYRVCAENFEI